MSPSLFALSASTFALGFAEFGTISLVAAIASDTGLSLAAVGAMVGFYAFGVSIGAPALSAWLARAPRHAVLASAMLVFSLTNVLTAVTGQIELLLLSRLIAGLVHGLVISLAAATASEAVEPAQSGRAIATVFGGLTLALMIGVPLGSYAASMVPWQSAFWFIAFVSALSAWLLFRFKPRQRRVDGHGASHQNKFLATVTDLRIVLPVAITALAYTGSFTGFTYISVLLEKSTGLGASGVTAMFVLYGASAAIGNTLGGRFVDWVGSRAGILWILTGLLIAMGTAWLLAESILAMSLAVALWGFASFGAVPVLQKTVLVAAQQNTRASSETASGLNIAAFNVGIAAGSWLGGVAVVTSSQWPMALGLIPLVIAMALALRLRPPSTNTPLSSNLINHPGT